MPSAEPNSRTASFSALATPRLLSPTLSTIAAVAGEVLIPMPRPSRTMPEARCRYEPSRAAQPVKSMETPSSTMPATLVARSPTRLARKGPIGATAIRVTAIGNSDNPADNALYPRRNCRYWMIKKM